ncbi:MAG: Pycsar system effector family protein [Myxococcales bacterium]
MGKGDQEIVRLAGQYMFELFRGASAGHPLIYHGFKRSRELVEACKEIAKGCKLNGDDGQVLLLSAWFHDAGYAVANEGEREKGIELARAFLARQGQPESVADSVAACLEVVDDENSHASLADEVLHDALLAPLASKNYVEEAELLRLEEERRTARSYSDVEWTQGRIDYLQRHAYRTRWAQLEYNGQRAKNLVRLHKLLRRRLGQATEQKAEEAKISKGVGKTVEGIFGDLTRSQLKLLSIADRRTSTMIHVNAIMMSLVVGLVLRKIEEHHNLLIPTVALLCVNLAVVVLSVVSLRAGSGRRVLRDDISAHDANLLLVTNEVEVPLPDYRERMNQLVADAPALQKAMIEYLYFGRKLLIHRRRTLQLTYDIFIYGLAVAVVLFTVAIARQ